jgi:glyoxylase-like metal-dependent hydrolase (beta-lactamase superfamily II)
MNLPPGVHFFERGWLSANNILLLDATQAILVDTGYHTHGPQTLNLLQRELRERPLTHILNTHLHSDHCGGNALLQGTYKDVLTFTPPGLAAHVRNWDPYALSYTPTGQHCPAFTLSDVLAHGQQFEVAGLTWEVHSAPGHDPHSVILFCPQERILISADALWENGFGVVFPEIEGEDAFQEVADTLDLIESLAPELILPGHGCAFTDVTGALSRARSKLALFVNAPEKHAIYAAKVLLKFKLLELQQIELDQFLAWARDTEYLTTLYAKYGQSVGIETWLQQLCEAMQRSGACEINNDMISNA